MENMKKIVYIISALVAMGMGASSCANLLKPESPSSFDAETIFSTYDLAEGSVIGIMQIVNTNNSYRNRFLPWYGYNTDIEWYNTYSETDDKSKLTTYNCLPNNSQLDQADGCYTHIYTGIERANLCIEGIPANSDIQNDPKMAYLYAEALTYRALLYYDLCKAWGDVPARFSPLTSETIYIPKSGRDVIFKHILSDLEVAIPLLPYPGTNAVTSRTDRVNKVFAEGLYARIALMAAGMAMRPESAETVGTGDLGEYKKTDDPELQADVLYPKALEYLKDAITNGGCRLEPVFGEYWKRQNAQQNLSFDGETLYVIPFGQGRGQWNNYFALRAEQGTRYNTYTGARGGSAGPLPYLYWKYDEKDVRRDVTCANWKWDKDTDELKLSGIANWYFGKYRFDQAPTVASGADDCTKPVVMRYADILLMAAEIDNEISAGPTAFAKDCFKEVRARAFLGNEEVANAYVDALSGHDDFFNAIIDERAFEFCGEMLRKADLIRWGKLLDKMKEAKKELFDLRDHTAGTIYANLPDDVYYQYDDATESITVWGFKAGEDTKPAGNWTKAGSYYSKVQDSSGKDTGLADKIVNGIYTYGDDMIYYMYWPLFTHQISTSQNTLVNDYKYE